MINLFLLSICAFLNVKKAFFAMLGIYLYTIFIIFQRSESFIQYGDENLNFVNLQIIFMGVSLSFIVFSHIPKKLLKSFISLILIFVWVLGSFLVSYTYYIEKSKVDTEVSSSIESMESQFKEHIENYSFALAFASTMLSIEGEVPNEKWQEMSSQLKINERYPGIFGLGFIYSVDRKEISSWLSKYNARNKVDIEYKSLYDRYKKIGIQPDRAFIISAIEPLSNNVSVLGLDVATEENRYAAAIKSIHLKKPTITNRIRLKNAKNKPHGFLYYHPTFNKWTSQFVGWSYAAFSWEDFFKKIVSTHNSPLINYSIGLLDFSNQDLLVKSQNFDPKSEMLRTSDIPFADKFIRLTWQINPEHVATQFTHISWISAVISIISLLLYSLVISMIQSKEKIAAMVILKEEELKESQFQLLQASKLSSLGEMAGGIAHEINNPLAIIRARAGLLRQLATNNKITTEKIIESTDVIDKTILRVTKIIDGLRSFSRAPNEAEPYLPMTVSSIIDGTLIFCNEKFKNHGIELRLEIDQSLMIKARETQLSQVILNLLNNSYDAIEDQENPWIEIKVSGEGNFALINIRDSGEGIPDSIAEKMMQPFYTTKEVGKGTGLGLSISSRIVQEHGGILSFDRGQKNTSFTLRIPLH